MEEDRTIDVGALVDKSGIGRAQWALIALCALVALLDGLDLQSIGLAAPAMSAQLGIAPRAFGAVFSAALAGLTIGAFVLGPVADRVGRKGVLVASTIVFGVFTLLTAAATGLSDLLAYRFLAGVGLGGAMPSFISLASEYVPAGRRATVVSLLWAGFPLGGSVGGVLASWLIPAYGWQSVFLAGGVLPIVVAALLLAVLPESAAFMITAGRPAARIARTLRRVYPGVAIPDAARFVRRGAEATDASVRHLFGEGRGVGTVLLWVSFFFAFMILVTNSSWSPALLGREGVPVARTALALAAYNLASLFGSAAAGWLLTRFGAYVILPLTLAGGAVAFALIGQVAPSVPAIITMESVFGLLLGCGSSGLIALSAIYYPAAIRSTGVGWATAMGRLGSFTGPLAVGTLVEGRWGVTSIYAVVAASTLIGVAAIAAAGLLRRREAITA